MTNLFQYEEGDAEGLIGLNNDVKIDNLFDLAYK